MPRLCFNNLPSLLKYRISIMKDTSANLSRIAKHWDMMPGQQLAAFEITPTEKKIPIPIASIGSTMISGFSKYAKITGKHLLQNGQPSKSKGSFEMQIILGISEKKATATHARDIKKWPINCPRK
jgi:hypothetical protein